MRICLVSDTHRFRHELLLAVKSSQPIAAVVHAGDETSDCAWLTDRVQCPVFGVSGNWDTVNEAYPEERIVEFAGIRLYVVHGHQMRVKEGLEMLMARAVEVAAHVVVFGHTHAATAVLEQNILFVNPGSLAAPRGRRERTFALLDIESADTHERVVRVAHCTTAGNSLADLILTTRIQI